MKFALITDQHFMVRDSSEYFLNNYEDFYTNVFFPHLVENNIKTIVCLGDTWEDRRKLNINGLQRSQKMYFDEAERLGIKIITILGNHDIYYKNTNEINSINFLEKRYKNIELIYDYKVVDFDGVKVALCSWINKENYNECLEFIKTCDADYFAAHLEITGFEMTRGNKCEHGMNPDLFKRFKEVWSGHFHIKSKQGNIYYLGNPSQTNKGDYGYTRGFHVFDTDSRKMEFIENPYKVYERITYTDDVNILEFDFKKYTNLFVNVMIKSYISVNAAKLNLFVEELNKHAYNVDVDELENELSNVSLSEDNEYYASNLDIINEYVDTVIEDGTDCLKLKTILHDLYNEAIELVEDE